jgi:hypothetical protein
MKRDPHAIIGKSNHNGAHIPIYMSTHPYLSHISKYVMAPNRHVERSPTHII